MPHRSSTFAGRLTSLAVAVFLAAACAQRIQPSSAVPFPAAPTMFAHTSAAATICESCVLPPFASELKTALESRVSDLKHQGGACTVYAEVLEKSIANGSIEVRPFMWRVGSNLTSGQARPDGKITVARDIDSLNVGVRKIQDVVRTVEHEAVHVAFSIHTGAGSREPMVDARLEQCNAGGP